MVDDATWWALTLTLTLLGALWTMRSYRRRGVAPGLRAAGITLLPLAALLTGTLRLGVEVGQAVGDWAARLVFSPSMWMGLITAGVAGLLIVVGGSLTARGRGTTPREAGRAGEAGVGGGSSGKQPRLNRGKAAPPPGAIVDDDLADIEAILKKRGIT